MASDEQVLLMSDRFEAFELKSLIRKPRPRPVVSAPPEQPVAITPDGSLAPHVLYEASDDPACRYYLPRYELRTVGGRHTSRLRLRTADEDPHGPLGWLSVELVAVPPVDTRHTLRAIDHVAQLRLGYEMPVVDARDGALAGPDAFEGSWTNVDANTRGMTRLVIARNAGGAWSMHGFGRCHPSDCDWGVTGAEVVGDALVATYRFGFKTTTLTARLASTRLSVDVFDDYTDADGRTDRRSVYELSKTASGTQSQPLIWQDLGPLTPVGENTHRCVVPFHAQADYDRIAQILTATDHRARLEIACRATLGQRSWQQWWLKDRATVAVMRPELSVVQVNSQLVKRMRQSLNDEVPAAARVGRPDPAIGRRRPGPLARPQAPMMAAALRTPQPVRPAVMAAPRAVALDAAPAMAVHSLRIDSANMASLVAPDAVRLAPQGFRPLRPRHDPDADEALPAGARERFVKAVPRRLVVDAAGQPVLVRRELQCLQSLPFVFDRPEDADVVDAPLDPATAHVLFKHDLNIGSLSVSFFQDSLARDQVYYEPQEFRLARSETSPFLPSLLFAINEVVTESEALQYRVRIAFNARPYLGNDFLLMARQHFGPAVRLTALTPSSARLALQPPSATGEPATPEERTGATVSFDEGITDELTLDEDQFVRLAAALQSPGGVGMQGMVTATLSDGSEVDIPLLLSLKENAGSPFDAPRVLPSDDGVLGHHTVTLRNRIESPVRIHAVSPVILGSLPDAGGGSPRTVTAMPLDLPPAEPVLPGQTVQIRYRVSAPEFEVLSLQPALDIDILPELSLLMGRLTVTESFTEATFAVDVSASPLYFGDPGLGRIQVEFESGPTVALVPGLLNQTVVLKKSLMSRILNLDPAYRYRLTLTDAQGVEVAHDWTSGVGNLQVQLP